METRGPRRSPSPWPHGRRVRAPPRSLREGVDVSRRLARHALPKRVALVAVRAVELLEGLALMPGGEAGVRPLGRALLGRVLERRDLLGVTGIRGGLVLVRLGGHALAVGVLAAPVGSVELLERLPAVRRGEIGIRPLRLAVLRGALESGPLLGVPTAFLWVMPPTSTSAHPGAHCARGACCGWPATTAWRSRSRAGATSPSRSHS